MGNQKLLGKKSSLQKLNPVFLFVNKPWDAVLVNRHCSKRATQTPRWFAPGRFLRKRLARLKSFE